MNADETFGGGFADVRDGQTTTPVTRGTDGQRPRADLAWAILGLSKAKDPQSVKRDLIRQAREIGAVDLLPRSWGIEK